MAISVTTPIELATDRTKRILFKPFQAGKWFKMGFCAFLAGLGGFGGGGGGGGGGSGPGGGWTSAEDWWTTNWYWLMPLVTVVALVVVGLAILLTWLRSRGRFMFLDGVVRNRGAVVEPWKTFRTLGNSLFAFNLLFSLAVIAAFALIGGVAVAIAWPDIQTSQLGPAGIAAIIIGALPALLVLLAAAVTFFLLDNFVVPAMYLRGEGVMAAWGTVRREILPGKAGAIVLFLLMRIVLGIAIGVMCLLVTCLTCCIAGLPYISAVVFLPFTVFMQAYTLHFLQQLGPQWRFFVDDDGPHCAYCGYNLTGNASGICPECGQPATHGALPGPAGR
ncbi:MAG TPA: hypothetical protein VLM89_04510 [Phycisphaerae bacterium]|nr:hypothetical protein [Phycisphaerae bacterium]